MRLIISIRSFRSEGSGWKWALNMEKFRVMGSRLRPIKKNPLKVINLQGILISVAVRTGLEPENVHNLIFKLLQRPYIFSVTNM